jgi:hypothetical protein
MAILLDIQAMLVNQTLSQINTAFQIQDLASLTTTDLSLKESQAPTWISSGHVMAPRDKQC